MLTRVMMFLALLALPFGHATAEDAKGKATVTVLPKGDQLEVTITLDRAVGRLALEEADVVRTDSLKVQSEGLSFADDAFTAARPFREVRFRLDHDVTERDAKYPPFYRVGKGRLLYAQATYPDLKAWDVTLAVAGLPDGWTRWPADPLPMGYLFLGPEATVWHEGGVRFVFDGTGDGAFEAAIRDTVVRAVGHLTETFGTPPVSEPFVATNVLSAEHRFSTGDVTDGAMIGLRFYGPAEGGQAIDPLDAGSLASTRSMILHEGVHFWNGGRARFAAGTPQWLHEGGAEYLATLGSLRLGWTSQADLRRTVGTWYDRCSTSLRYSDEVALNDLKFINASLRYSCGPLLHTLAELYLAEKPGGETVTSGWRRTVEGAASTGGEYDLPAFLTAIGDPNLLQRPALAAILATSGKERWRTVLGEMRRLGVGIALETTPPLRARTALMHLIRSQCTALKPGQSYGFYSGATSYRLDTPEGCGLLAGGPTVVSLAGHPVTELTGEDYAGLQAICVAGGTVAFGIESGSVIAVPCGSPMPDPAPQPAIGSLPDLPAFAEGG